VGLVASQSYLRKVNRTTLFESEIAEMKQVFDKYSMDTEGCDENGKNCTLAVMVLGKTMRALGENVSDREAMSTALNGNLIDSQASPPSCLHFSFVA
jgi:Ca2+-binding EF-hand superfamily protein